MASLLSSVAPAIIIILFHLPCSSSWRGSEGGSMASAEKWASGFPMFLCIIIPNQRKQCIWSCSDDVGVNHYRIRTCPHKQCQPPPPIPEYTWSYGKVMPKVEVNL